MSHHYIELKEVSYEYPNGKTAVDKVSFRINHGESVGLIGENGAGKSTLLSLMPGLIMPQSGTVDIGGTILTKKTMPYIRQSLGYIFQDSDDQLFMPTVYEDVAFGLRNHGMEEDEVEKVVKSSLERVGILHLSDRPAYRLSGGEKKAAAIASVIAMQPDILIMDEPSSALDPKARRRLMKLLDSFSHTKLIAAHDLDLVLELCERVIVINEGCIVHDGKSQEILTNQTRLEECGLELPLMLQTYTK